MAISTITQLEEWCITVGIDNYFLTTQEKDFFIQQAQQGREMVVLRGGRMCIPSKIQKLLHIDEIRKAKETEEQIKLGKWQCTFGSWHTGHCLCNVEFIEEGDVFYVRLRNPNIGIDPNTPKSLDPNLTLQSAIDASRVQISAPQEANV